MSVCTIYLVSNNVNDKVYVGQTWNSLAKRFRGHCSSASASVSKLGRAIRKHGSENFRVESIGSAGSQEVADWLEKTFILEYDAQRSGYNIREGGSRGKHSKESCAKISGALSGVRMSDERRARMSASRKGVKKSEEFKANLSKYRTGKTLSVEARMKLSEYRLGSKHSEETRNKLRSAWLRRKARKVSDGHDS